MNGQFLAIHSGPGTVRSRNVPHLSIFHSDNEVVTRDINHFSALHLNLVRSGSLRLSGLGGFLRHHSRGEGDTNDACSQQAEQTFSWESMVFHFSFSFVLIVNLLIWPAADFPADQNL